MPTLPFRIFIVSLFIGIFFFVTDVFAEGLDFRGFVSLEGLLFPQAPLHPGQEDHTASVAMQPDLYYRFDNGSFVTFIPFLRVDSADSARTHFDIRQMSLNMIRGDWEFRLGVRREFWGTVEFIRLVDIINQIDLVDSPTNYEKLGQPMVNASYFTDYGVFDFYILPWFRERTFPGKGGRVRSSLIVDTDQTRYQSGAQEKHVDFAFRYFNSFGDLDLGLSYFRGTGRNPLFQLGFRDNNPVLVPFYEQIQQAGIDAQYVLGNLFLKFEGIFQAGSTNDFFAAATGFEYTIPSLFQTGKSLGFLMEFLHDDRGPSGALFEEDIGYGLRFAFNDAEGSAILAAVIQDLDTPTRVLLVQASTLLTEHWRLTAEYRAFMDPPPGDLLTDFRKDDFFNLSLTYFFNIRKM